MKKLEEGYYLRFKRIKKQIPVRSTNIAVVYTRVSSADQLLNASIENQKEICIEYAERRGLRILEFFGETNESAQTDERIEFQRMLLFAKKNKSVSHILVYCLDRFSRTGTKSAELARALYKDYGIALLSAKENVDASTPQGRFHQNMSLIASQYDNEVRRDRIVEGMTKRLKEGYWPLAIPIGYSNLNKGLRCDNHKVVVNAEGKILKNAWTWKIKYRYSNKEIVKRLRKAGLEKITEKKLSKIFRNPFYCGKIVSSLLGDDVVEGKHQKMVSPETFYHVNEIMEGRFTKGKHSKEVGSLLPLKRFVLCGECDKPLTGYLVKSKNLYYYKCRTVGCKKNKSQKKLHTQFIAFLKGFEVRDFLADHVRRTMYITFNSHFSQSEKEVQSYRESLMKLNKRIEQFEERFVYGEVDKALYDKHSLKFRKEKKEIKELIANSSVSSSNLEKGANWVVSMSRKISDTWSFGNSARSEAIQQLLFPNGISYDWENERFRTSRINLFFGSIPCLLKGFDGNKKGIQDNFYLKSLKVEPEGFEPSSKQGINKLSTNLVNY